MRIVTAEDAALSCSALLLPLGAASLRDERPGEQHQEAERAGWTGPQQSWIRLIPDTRSVSSK